MGTRRSTGMTTVAAIGFAIAAAAISGTPSPVSSRGEQITAAVSGELPAERMSAGLRSLTVAATGDVLTENAVVATAQRAAIGTGRRYDFRVLMAPVEPIISSAHLAICHMEIPIGGPGDRPGIHGRSPFGGNLLLAPAEIASGLSATGFDRCSTASNHSNDLGSGGIDSTLAALDGAGIGHVGTARTQQEAVDEVFTVNGVRVAHLAYTTYSNTVLPADLWRINFQRDARAVIDDVARVRAAGAEVVIVSLHVSQELQRGPIDTDRNFVSAITAAGGVDLVIEHGPHVVQPVEQVNGTWVYWSVGNFLSGMGQPGATRYGPPTLDGLLAWVRFTETESGQFVATPTSVLICSEIAGRVVYPAVTMLADPTIDGALRGQLQACLDRSRSLVPDVQ